MRSSSDAELTIGELASHFGLATHVLRHWESVGVLQPARRVNGRRYHQEHLTRVAIIVHARELGFGLDEIRAILNADDGAGRRTVLRRHLDELERRIAQAQAAKRLIEHALACEAEDFLACPRFQRLVHTLGVPDCAGDSWVKAREHGPGTDT